MALRDVMKGGTPYMGISPRRARPCTHRPEREQERVSQACLLMNVINQAQFDAGFAHGLILKDGAVPAMKDPGRDSELQMVSETASNVYFVGDWSKCSSLFSSTHLLELGCFRKLYLSFIIVIKLKTFWRHVILSVKTQVIFVCDLLFSTKKKKNPSYGKEHSVRMLSLILTE